MASPTKRDFEVRRINSVEDVVEISEGTEIASHWMDGPSSAKLDAVSHPRTAIWYRGQAEAEDWDIEPSVFREEGATYYAETNLASHYKLRCAKLVPESYSEFDWLCHMAHHGCPTRLLDWSESILVALYFAADTLPDRDGALVCLNADSLNALSTISDEPAYGVFSPDKFDVAFRAGMATRDSVSESLESVDDASFPGITRQSVVSALLTNIVFDKMGSEEQRVLRKARMPVAVFPARRNQRMVAQHSVFTVHGGKLYTGESNVEPIGIELTSRDMSTVGMRCLSTYRIPAENKKRILDQLFRLNIHPGTLFPDVEGQVKYLKQVWRSQKPR